MAYKMTTNKSWVDTERELSNELLLWRAQDYSLRRGNRVDDGSKRVGRQPARPVYETPEQATVELSIRWKSGRILTLKYNQQARSVDNLRVLFLVVKALRLNELRGIDDVMRDAYLQLPGPTPVKPKRSPYDVLNISPSAPLDVAEASYKVLARLAHPDRGGSVEAMQELNEAIDQLRKGQRPV
jgi:hypothetical protein